MAGLTQKTERQNGIFKGVEETFICWDRTPVENIPADVNAFFGHPLTAATNAIEGADSLALLHEYQNLPPIDNNKEQYQYGEMGDNKINAVDELLVLEPSVSGPSQTQMNSPKPEDLRICRASDPDVIATTDSVANDSLRDQISMFNVSIFQQSLRHPQSQLIYYSMPTSHASSPQKTLESHSPRKTKHKKVRRKHEAYQEEKHVQYEQRRTSLPMHCPRVQVEQTQSHLPQLIHYQDRPASHPSPSPHHVQNGGQINGSPARPRHSPPAVTQQLQSYHEPNPKSIHPQALTDFRQTQPVLLPVAQNVQVGQIPPLPSIHPAQQPSYIPYTTNMDTLNNNIPASHTSVSQSHSVLQAALNSKPMVSTVITHQNQPRVSQNSPHIKHEMVPNPNNEAALHRTINSGPTWTPATNSAAINFSSSIHIPMSDTPQPIAVNLSDSSLLSPAPSQPSREPGFDRHEVLSVDSGISDSCVSPPNPPQRGRSGDVSLDGSSSSTGKGKRRLSQSIGGGPYLTRQEKDAQIPKRSPDYTGFRYILEAPTSSFQRVDEDRVTYINKSQYYSLTLECDLSVRKNSSILRSEIVKSVIIVVLRCEKNVDECNAWELWYSRQHNSKQRVIDIDTKKCSGIILESVQEIAHNALSFSWRPREGIARANIALHCLSTDFSNQKGVKGVPLHLQVDTFEDDTDRFPTHRGYCQVKAFCDKGAERKIRDEERRKETKQRLAEGRPTRKKPIPLHPPSNRSEFYSILDLEKTPFLFFGYQMPNQQIYLKGSYPSQRYQSQTGCSCNCGCHEPPSPSYSPSKKPKLDDSEKILLYARRRDETVFTALVLRLPTAECLKIAIGEKFQVPSHEIRNIFKLSMKGIIVKMDDDMIQNYTNESTFEMDVVCRENGYDVQLNEIEPCTPRYR